MGRRTCGLPRMTPGRDTSTDLPARPSKDNDHHATRLGADVDFPAALRAFSQDPRRRSGFAESSCIEGHRLFP